MPTCSQFNAHYYDIRHDTLTSLPLSAVKGKGGHDFAKCAVFCHNTVSSYPMCMKPASNYSLFYSLHSHAKYRKVAAAKVCALPSAHSSWPFVDLLFRWFRCPFYLLITMNMSIGLLTLEYAARIGNINFAKRLALDLHRFNPSDIWYNILIYKYI